MKHLALKTKALRNRAAWPAELFPAVSRAGRLTEQFFILVLNSLQAAVVSATERLSCHRKERQKDGFRKCILKIRFVLQELSNLRHG